MRVRNPALPPCSRQPRRRCFGGLPLLTIHVLGHRHCSCILLCAFNTEVSCQSEPSSDPSAGKTPTALMAFPPPGSRHDYYDYLSEATLRMLLHSVV